MRRALALCSAVYVCLFVASSADSVLNAASTIRVAAGGNLQAALDAAQPGDVILLPPGATFLGNFVLRVKSGSSFITLQTEVSETGAFAPGVRMTPAAAASLAKIQSSNTASALRTEAGAHHWRIQLLQFGPNTNGYGDIIDIGDGGSAQNSLSLVPYTFVLDRLYVFGDPLLGQKRGIGINARDVTVTNSTVRDIKTIGQDTQALAGWNGPGPYHIENNYLEAAGENFMLGGADPSISGLIASTVTFRRNYLSRPVSWRDPIVPTPTGVTSALTTGVLPAGTYKYQIVARRQAGQGTIANSSPSATVTVSLGAPGGVRLTWTSVKYATEYRIYRTIGTNVYYWTVQQSSFTDSGNVGTAGALPSASRWTVKNVFELKNAQNLLVEQNVFENNWEAAQAGYAIVLTPRNSNGSCTWCTIQNLEFRYNIVRHTGGAVSILGYDDPSRPSVQARGLNIHNNLFYDVNKTNWGGSGVFLLIGDEPRNVTINHNTIDHDGSMVASVFGGTTTDPREIYGFVYTNNLSRHGLYGIFGNGLTWGLPSITAYFPDAVFRRNLLSGGTASKYPPDNFFSPSFDTQFVALGTDYHLIASSPFRLAGTDGLDLGPDMTKLPSLVSENIVLPLPPVSPQNPRVIK